MSAYRITRALLRGQFASSDCFEKWLEAQTDAGNAQLVTVREDPGIPAGGVSDARYYLWLQIAPVLSAFPKTCNPDLVNFAGKNEWATQAEAQAVIDAKLKQGAAIAAEVKKANEKAVSAGNIAAGVAEDVAAAGGKALDAATPVVGVVAGVVAVGAVGWVVFQLLRGR